MGKVIQLRAVRARSRQRHSVGFAAFGELEQLERAQLKLFAICTGGAALIMAALQLATR